MHAYIDNHMVINSQAFQTFPPIANIKATRHFSCIQYTDLCILCWNHFVNNFLKELQDEFKK